jgi:hypothetical protein
VKPGAKENPAMTQQDVFTMRVVVGVGRVP